MFLRCVVIGRGLNSQLTGANGCKIAEIRSPPYRSSVVCKNQSHHHGGGRNEQGRQFYRSTDYDMCDDLIVASVKPSLLSLARRCLVSRALSYQCWLDCRCALAGDAMSTPIATVQRSLWQRIDIGEHTRVETVSVRIVGE